MILVAGLGNPGSRYADTRHNVGAMVVDELAKRAGLLSWRSAYRGRFGFVVLGGERVGLLRPETFMNLSGQSVRPAMAFYRLQPDQLLVIHDDLDLPFGELRLKFGGGDAGHKGLRSINEELGSSDFGRLRFGIGRPPEDFGGDVSDFVLEAFTPAERAGLQGLIGTAADAVELVVSRGMAAAMNTTNQRNKS